MKTKLAIASALTGAALLGALLTSFGVAQQDAPKAASGFSAAQEDEIRALVRDYLVENPDIIIEAIGVYQERERAAADEKLVAGARENLQTLLSDTGGATVGADAEKAKVAVIEFFDYHCGYCKRATGLVQELTKRDPDVKVVFRELPILREESRIAAEYALAAREQGKYAEFHFALMEAQGVLSEKRIKEIAKKSGLDVGALAKARSDAKIANAIDETLEIAKAMGADGTPTFIVASLEGDFMEVMPGYRAESILEAVEKAKKAAR